ncbi:MAG: hypothetical protein U0R70_12965 [Solirubrobacteraceae bacterium]
MPDPSTLHAAIDQPAPGATVVRGTVRVTGWALDEAGPFGGAVLVVDSGPGAAPVRLGTPRPDLAAPFASIPHAAAGGFEGTVDVSRATGATVRIALLVQRPGGAWAEAASTEATVARAPRQRAGQRSAAAFTIAHDEPVMLPLWLDYYRRHFPAEDLFVLAHDDPAAEALAREAGAHAVPVHREAAFDHRWLRSTVEAFQAFLLRSYEAVLFAEADEFVVADPRRYSGLAEYIARLDAPAARCSGYNVVHQPGEPPLDVSARPVLAQRRRWHASLDYSKRLLARMPLRWSEGFHREYDAPDAPPDPHLVLVHLHRADYDLCLARHRASAARPWNPDDLDRGDGAQNRIVQAEAFAEWFRRGPDLDAPAELIPGHFRECL